MKSQPNYNNFLSTSMPVPVLYASWYTLIHGIHMHTVLVYFVGANGLFKKKIYI